MSGDEETAHKRGWGENTDREGAWERVQIKAFTHWVNSVLHGRHLKVNDLGTDFKDGVMLANFLELLTRKKMQFTKKPSLKIQSIENLSICLKHITGECGVRLVGIGAEDIYEGNVKLILGLLWSLFRRFKIQTISTDNKSSEEGLLLWVKSITRDYDGVNITNYGDSFRDGLAFMALVDKFTEGDVNYEDYKDDEPQNRLQVAFEMLEKRVNVPKLLDPEEVATGFVDERALVLYLSLIFHAFKAKEEAEAIERRKRELAGQVEREQSELSRTKEERDALELERDKLNKESAEINAALHNKSKSVEELSKKNQEFNAQIDQFRVHVSKQGEQLKDLRRWLKWEREGLKQLKELKAEREARFASLKALQTQLELHAGYMVALRDKHYAAIPDNFDDDVRPKLEKKLKGMTDIPEQIDHLSGLFDAEAKRIALERASVKRIHAGPLAEAKAAKKAGKPAVVEETVSKKKGKETKEAKEEKVVEKDEVVEKASKKDEGSKVKKDKEPKEEAKAEKPKEAEKKESTRKPKADEATSSSSSTTTTTKKDDDAKASEGSKKDKKDKSSDAKGDEATPKKEKKDEKAAPAASSSSSSSTTTDAAPKKEKKADKAAAVVEEKKDEPVVEKKASKKK